MPLLSDNTNLFKRLSLDESLRRTFAVYCEGFRVFTSIGLCSVATEGLLWGVLLYVLRSAFGIDDDADFEDPNFLMSHMGAFYGLLFANMIIGIVVGAVFNGAMVRVVADIYLQRKASTLECLQLGARHACTIMASTFFAMLIILAGLLLFIVPGMWLSVMFFVVSPAIVIEGLGVFASIKRSYNLVKGSWCYVFCMQMIVMIFVAVLQMIWSAIFAGGNDANHTIFSISGSIISAIPGIIFIPVLACMMTIMYINLRVEKEAVTAERLAENLAESCGNTALYSALLTEETEEAAPIA